MEKIIVTTPEELSALIDERFRIAFKHYAPQLQQRLPEETPVEAGQTYVSKKQAARLLDCSQSTIDNFARSGRLTRSYVGKAVRFDRQQVLSLAQNPANRKRKTN